MCERFIFRIASSTPSKMMSDTFRRETRKFDLERVLPAWDGLITKQQSALHELGVPLMFVTSSKSDVEVKSSLYLGLRLGS
jgi:hypothetical protein